MSNNTVVLIPGGFKPPHGGHLAIVNQLANNYDYVKVIIGKMSRDGISADMSKTIWGYLPLNKNVSIIISNDSTPIVTCYNYVFELPDENITVGLASGNKEDDNRSVLFKNNIEKYKTTPTKDGKIIKKSINPIVINYNTPIKYTGRTDNNNGNYISANVLRNDLINGDYNNFKTNYPNIDDSVVKNIYKILVSKIMKPEKKAFFKKIIKEMIDEDVNCNLLNLVTSDNEADFNKGLSNINKRATTVYNELQNTLKRINGLNNKL